jgi:pimeloyl-ACP methyl ester carboxylesterase
MTTQFFEHTGGRLAYDDQGIGPLVVCAPSMGDLRGEYRFLRPQLVRAGYRAVSLDVRGHGESSTAWDDFSVGAIGRDLIALIRYLNAGPAVIVGTSMAAGAAVVAAAEAPEAVSGLVLIGPFVRGEPSAGMNLLFSVMFARPWGPAAWAKYYASLYPSRKPADFAIYAAALQANLKEPGRLEALQHMLKASKRASEERLPRVKAPALVIMGSKDPDFKQPEAEAAWVGQQLRARVDIVPNAGHYPHAEMPEIVGPMIVSFVRSLQLTKEVTHAA